MGVTHICKSEKLFKLNQSDHNYELIAKFLSGEVSSEEEAKLLAWLDEHPANQKFFEELASIWNTELEEDQPPFSIDLTAAWKKIDVAAKSPTIQKAKQKNLVRRTYAWSLAAVLVLTIGAMIWFFLEVKSKPEIVTIKTGIGQRTAIILPDQSRVWLNSNSNLVYNAGFKERELKLEGEGFFEVVSDRRRPFIVSTKEATVAVLGTSFNLRAYGSENTIEVEVKTGRVTVNSLKDKSKKATIAAGSSAVLKIENQQLIVTKENDSNSDAWKSRQLVFNDVELREVLNTLERYFEIEFEITNTLILDCHLKATFDNPDIEDVLAVLSATFGLEIEHDGGRYILRGVGCASTN
jgi:ferric-dicitrate binding protein FerR (iron transport regulator)